MDEQTAGSSVFMCRLCNLFSPSRSLLLAHCSQLHPEQERHDDLIIALQPLAAEPLETQTGNLQMKKLLSAVPGPTENPVKRKRGRPKGSTKKTRIDVAEGETDSTHSQVVDVQKQGGKNQEEVVMRGESNAGTLGLECRDCHRSFSNRRQILKHICLKDEQIEEEEDRRVHGGAEVEGSLDHGGPDTNQAKQNSAKPTFVRYKDLSSFRPRSRVSKDGGPSTGNKKPVISVVLTEDETLPGVSQMVPVEETSTETESVSNPAQTQLPAVFQSQSQDLESEATTKEIPKTDEQSSNLSSTTTSATISRGFQEYSIKQDSTNLLQSQLKIFTCQFCNKIFKFRHSLIAHLRTHTQEKPFQCPHCDYASAIKANLNVHLRKHTGEKFSCQQCPFNCLSPGHLKVHVERVHLKVKQHCSYCEKKYSDVKNLLKHMDKRHNLKDPAVYHSYQQLRLKTRQGLRQLLYHCPTCNRRFKNQLQRERHMLIHGPQRPFACLLCDHAATKMSGLAAHVRKHLFLYVCCVCDGKFVSSHRLKTHLKESHSEMEQEQTFTDCINSSYYLTQPGGTMWGEEEREGVEKEAEQNQSVEEEGQDKITEEVRRNGVGGEEWHPDVAEREVLSDEREAPGDGTEEVQVTEGDAGKHGESNNGGPEEGSQGVKESLPDVAASDSEARHEENSEDHAQVLENTHPGLSDLSEPPAAAPPGDEDQSPHSDKDSELFDQNAFHQVISSLHKTRLNVETFQRLRKIYGDLECQYCGKLFWYKVHYNVHVRTHTKEHSHYCSKCNYSSITKSSLKRHQIQKHSGVMLPCSHPGCTYTTPDKYKLQAHVKTHQGQGKSVECPVCQHSYPEHRLKHHIKTAHPDSVRVRGKGLMVQRAEKCPYCDSYFLKNSSDFQQHIWAHQGLKPYVCSVCDYAGRSRSNLKTHMNRHNTERRHLCDLCGKKFKSKVTLKSHRLTHTDEGKPFQCSECDFTSVSKPSLLRHMEQHADFKPFRCAHCHYSCNIAGPLKRHYNMKHPDQKYENAGPGLPNPDSLKQQGGMKCPECEFVYGTKWELNRHLKSKHSLKVVEGVWEVGEAVEAQYVSVEDEVQAAATVAAVHNNVDIQQITEFSSETHDAVTSMVAMAPGTVAVVQQLQVADEQEVGNCGNQLMVVNAEGDLTGEQVMVVEDAHGLEALTVLTQGEDTHHYIVYVQEHTVEIN